jgi:CheY-like chemotaxis protein
VWNLLSNAIKFTPSQGQISVALRSVDSQVEITVQDSGAGIRTDVLPHVFDRFHQANSSIKRRFGGLGLGLAIVKHLVELHGGTVRAQSAGEGHGATFTISLPSSTLPVRPGSAVIAADEQETQVPVSLGGIRVLVVEDEPDTAEFVKRLLETNGATVTIAESAAAALSFFRNAPPDVLLSDIGLPDVDGYELLRQIRAEMVASAAGIPAIALTAYARPEDRRRALLVGYQAHLAKPVEATELLATIASFAGLSDARRREP